MFAFFKLIRWKNLLLLALVQYLIKYGLLEPFIELYGVTTTLKPFGFGVLVFATICIAAAGNIINDIFDLKADRINKPNKIIIGNYIPENRAFNLFIALNIIGVVLGYFISYQIGKSGFFAIFVIISGLLYLYSSYLKQYVIIGNVIISLLVSLGLLIVGIFELLPPITVDNSEIQITFFNIILDYAIFAFLINLIREVVKDIEDTEGDIAANYKTLTTVFGLKTAKVVALTLTLVTISSVVFYIIKFLYKENLVVGYFLIAIVAPLIYSGIATFQASKKQDYSKISVILKLIMLAGICSMLLFPFIQI